MPNKSNAKKALRQTIKRTAKNRQIKTSYKAAIKAVENSLTQGGKDVNALLKLAQKKLDKAAKRNVIGKNTAARKVSRLMKKAKAVK